MPDQLFYHLPSLPGILVLLGFAWAVSENRSTLPLRTVLAGLALQIALALLLLKLPAARAGLLSALVAAVSAAAMRALLSGTMASGLTGCIIGLLPVT